MARQKSHALACLMVTLGLAAEFSFAQTAPATGCTPKPQIEMKAERKTPGSPPSPEEGRILEVQNVGQSNPGSWARPLQLRFSPSGAGSVDKGHYVNAETGADVGSEISIPDVPGAIKKSMVLHAKSVVYLWAEDGEKSSGGVAAQASGTLILSTKCEPAPIHSYPPPGNSIHTITTVIDGFQNLYADAGVRKSGSMSVRFRRPFENDALLFQTLLQDSQAVERKYSITEEGSVEVSADVTLPAGPNREKAARGRVVELGLSATGTVTLLSEQFLSEAAMDDKGEAIAGGITVLQRTTECHEIPLEAYPDVFTNVSLALHAPDGNTPEYAAGMEIWGRETITVVSRPGTPCGTSGGTTPGPNPGGSPNPGGYGPGTTPPPLPPPGITPTPVPTGGPAGAPAPPPSGGLIVLPPTDDTEAERNGTKTGGQPFSSSAGANGVGVYEKSVCFYLEVDETFPGALSAPLHVRIASDQPGVAWVGGATASQIARHLPTAIVSVDLTQPIRLASGFWEIHCRFTGGTGEWVRFESSFDAAFPIGATAVTAVELIPHSFTLQEWGPGMHTQPWAEHRTVVRSTGPMANYVPLVPVSTSPNFEALSLNWEQTSGSPLNWTVPPFVRRVSGSDEAAIFWQVSSESGDPATVRMSLGDGGPTLEFTLILTR